MIDTATLKGQSLAGTLDLKNITRLLLRILKVDDADDLLQKLFPTDELIMQRIGGTNPDQTGSDQDPDQQDVDTQKEDPRPENLDEVIASTLKRINESLDEI